MPDKPTVLELLNAHRVEQEAQMKCKVARILEGQPEEVQEAMADAFADTKTFSHDVLLRIFTQTIAPVGETILRKHRNSSCGCFR